MANVNEISDHNKINVVTNVENNVTVTQPNIQTVEVLAGPRGQQGPTGPPGTGAIGGFTGSFSGSFLGDGSELNNIPADAIVGLNLSQIASGSFSASISQNGNFSTNAIMTGSGAGLSNIPASAIIGLNLSRIASGSVTASISPGGGLFINTNVTASGDISASSGTVTALTGSFNHIITDSETIEFRSKELGSRIGQLKFNSTNGLEVQDQLGARAKIRAARGEFLSLEAGPVGMNSLGPITGSNVLVNNNLIVLGTGSFTHFITTYESASIIYASGSTKFGDTTDDTHIRTGSMSITGSLVVAGPTNISDNISGSKYIRGNVVVGNTTGQLHVTQSTQLVVKVNNQTTDHRYYNKGSTYKYYINELTSPYYNFYPGKKYRFIQNDISNNNHPVIFYLQAERNTEYTTGVTYYADGVQANSSAYASAFNAASVRYTEIEITDTTPSILYYQCYYHAYMGNAVYVQGAQRFTAASGSFSGSFQGDGAGLTNVPASGVVGLNLSQIADGTATASISATNGFIVNTDTRITGSTNLSGSLKIRGGSALTGANIFEIKNTSADAYDDLFAFDDNGKITHEVDGAGDKHVIQTTSGATMFKFGVSAGSQGYLQIQNNGFTGAYLNNYGGAFGYGATVPSSGKSLYVLGDAEITGSLTMSGSISIPNSGSGITIDSGSLNVKRSAASTNIATFTPLNSAGRVEINDAEVKVTDTAYGYTAGRLYSSIQRTGEFTLHYWSGITGVYIQGNANEGGSTWQQNFIGGGLHVGSRLSATTNYKSHAFSVNGPSQLTGSLAVLGQVSASSYIGDGSGLTGLGGAYGISNSNGVYTYYGTLSASIAAASAGDVVEVFADVIETNPVTILFKNGVNIQGNGHTYTLDYTGSEAAFADYMSENTTTGTDISSSINNFNIRRLNGDSSKAPGYGSTIRIENRTSGKQTELNLHGSTIYNDANRTYYAYYRYGSVDGGYYHGDVDDASGFDNNASPGDYLPYVKNITCYFPSGWATVEYADNSSFTSLAGTYTVNVYGRLSNSYVYSRGRFAANAGNSNAELLNCNVDHHPSVNNGAAARGFMKFSNCTIRSTNSPGINTYGNANCEMTNNYVYSQYRHAMQQYTNYSSGKHVISGNTFVSDASYPTVYLRGAPTNDFIFSNNTIFGQADSSDAHGISITAQGSHDTYIVNNTIKVFNNNAYCIYGASSDTAFLAGNIYEFAKVPVHPNITQSFTNVPDEQGNIHVTSSLNNDRIYSGSFSGSFIGDGSLLTGVEAFPFTGDAQITGSLSFSGSLIDFTDAASVQLPAATVPLINPKVEYFTTSEITSSGTTVPLPGDLTFISSSTFEYLEIFINGLRLRYDIDFAPQSTGSVKYFVTLPSGTEVTYKSLNRP